MKHSKQTNEEGQKGGQCLPGSGDGGGSGGGGGELQMLGVGLSLGDENILLVVVTAQLWIHLTFAQCTFELHRATHVWMFFNSNISSSHAWVWKLDHKCGWALKNWCFQNVVLEKTLESPLDSKEIKPVNLKGNQLRMFIARTDVEAPILCPPDAKSQLIWKDSDAGNNWRQKEEEGSRGWDGWIISPIQWTRTWAKSGRSWGQWSLACCSPWGFEELDMT